MCFRWSSSCLKFEGGGLKKKLTLAVDPHRDIRQDLSASVEDSP